MRGSDSEPPEKIAEADASKSIEELFGGAGDEPSKEDEETMFSGLFDSDSEDYDPSARPKVTDYELCGTQLQSLEEVDKRLRKEEELMLQRKMFKRRYETKEDVKDLIEGLLSLHIFEKSANPGPIPTDFSGHSEYHRYWEHYFRKEVVSFLLNARHSDKVEEGRPSKVPSRLPHWVGYIVIGPSSYEGQKVLLYDSPPKIVENKEGTVNANKQLREHDVLYLTDKELSLNGDFKNTISLGYL